MFKERAKTLQLLSDFDEYPLANALEQKIKDIVKLQWKEKKRDPLMFSSFLPFDLQGNLNLYNSGKPKLIDDNWNQYHVGIAFVKALRILSKNDVIQLVSVTKTKLTRGFIHKESGAVFKIKLTDKVEEKVGDYLNPNIYLKYGEWKFH